jgi:hypothetical protein
LNLSLKGQIIGAVGADAESEIVVATQTGYAKRVNIDAIPYTSSMNSTGEKLMQRANLVSALVYQPEKSLWAFTNQGIMPIEQTAIPLDNQDKTDHSIAKLKKGEKLLSLFYS